VVAGEKDDTRTREMLQVLRSKYLPQAVILQTQPGKKGEKLAAITANAAGKVLLDGMPAVYICDNYTCQEPVTDPEELAERVRE